MSDHNIVDPKNPIGQQMVRNAAFMRPTTQGDPPPDSPNTMRRDPLEPAINELHAATIAYLDALRERDAALLAALDALVAENIEEEAGESWCRVCEGDKDPIRHAPECPIGKLAAAIATHREGR